VDVGLFGDDEDDDGTDDEDEEDEDEEVVRTRRLLNEEIRDLEAAVEKKMAELATVQNPLIKVCGHRSCLPSLSTEASS
jgi:transcription initiation factor TFIID subunit 7